jgi:CheY-like chemotaxis protein
MDQDVEAAALISRPEFTPARTVLLVDDDDLGLAHLSELVQAAGFEVRTAGDGATALTFLEQQFTPIVITDLNMPAMDGLALCRAIRQQAWPGYVYILLLTVHDGESDILAGLEAGADDYLSKRTSAAQLVARLHTAQRILGLEHALKGELEEKRRQSLTDPLTGAHNRRYFDQHLQRDFKRAQRGGGPLCLLMLDVDHFKRINDRMRCCRRWCGASPSACRARRTGVPVSAGRNLSLCSAIPRWPAPPRWPSGFAKRLQVFRYRRLQVRSAPRPAWARCSSNRGQIASRYPWSR